MILAYTYYTARDLAILYQGPCASVGVDKQAELGAVSTALANPDG